MQTLFTNFTTFYFIEVSTYARIAQLVEHSTDTRAVPSSNLGSRTKYMNVFENFNFAQVKGVLLDFDNTLYAYKPCHEKALRRLYDEYSTIIEALSYEDFLLRYKEAQDAVKEKTNGQAASHSRFLYVQHMLECAIKKTDVQKTLLLEETYWSSFMEEMKLQEGVIEFLAECKKRGVMVCLITDLTAAVQFRKIQRLGLDSLIDYVVTSEEAGAEKPEPLIFSCALKKLGLLPDDVVMIGDDSKKDIDGARNYNITAFQVI